MTRSARKRIASLIVGVVVLSAAVAAAPASSAAPEPVTILSSSWGLNNGTGCPNGANGLDNIPTTFNWFIRTSSIDVTDFVITRDDGTTATPVCALQFPPDERNEHQTVNLIGDFGDPAGARPVTDTVVGDLEGRPITQKKWRAIPAGLSHAVDQIEGVPYMVDSWVLSEKQLKGAVLEGVTIGSNQIQDPNGDPNDKQSLS